MRIEWKIEMWEYDKNGNRMKNKNWKLEQRMKIGKKEDWKGEYWKIRMENKNGNKNDIKSREKKWRIRETLHGIQISGEKNNKLNGI